MTLQDWITIRGTNATPIAQAESAWLDLAPYQDIVIYTDSREITGTTPAIAFQTAPFKDENLFQTMTGASFNLANGAVTMTKVLLSANPAIPLARYVRWQITGPASTWDATFKVTIAANSLCI